MPIVMATVHNGNLLTQAAYYAVIAYLTVRCLSVPSIDSGSNVLLLTGYQLCAAAGRA